MDTVDMAVLEDILDMERPVPMAGGITNIINLPDMVEAEVPGLTVLLPEIMADIPGMAQMDIGGYLLLSY